MFSTARHIAARHACLIVTLGCIVLLNTRTWALTITRGPYLQRVVPTGITVLWWTDNPASSIVRFGVDDTTTVMHDARPLTRHQVVLSDLPSDTEFRYSVASTANVEVASSETYAFRTAKDRNQGAFRFGALGSTGSLIATRGVTEDLRRTHPDFFLHLGDLFNAGDPDSNIDAGFFGPANKLLAATPFFTVLGVDEYPENDPSASPESALNLLDSPGDGRNYSFDYGAAHFVVLDTFALAATSWQLTSATRRWLANDLAAAATHPWTFVALHHPLFSSSADTERPWEEPLRDVLLPLFEEHGVDYVLGGHDTIYSRSNRAGITYLVSGGGGHALSDVSPEPLVGNPFHHRRAKSVFHSLVFDVRPTHVELEVRDPQGNVIDREAKSNLRRNVILFVGDGMGFEQVQAGRLWVHGHDDAALNFESRDEFPFQAEVITTLPEGGTTDSATAATAMATGYQHPFNGIISEAENVPRTTILELARDNGQRTGIITTTEMFNATVASFAAHDDSRNDVRDLRDDYLKDDVADHPGADHPRSLPNVVFGGGWSLGLVHPTYLLEAQEAGYATPSTRGELFAINMDRLDPPRVLGAFDRSTTNGLLISAYDRSLGTYPDHDEPDLAELTSRALDLLEEGDAGFFLVVENEHIDEIGHDLFPSRELQIAPEVASFDRAVRAALDWLASSGEAENTLILVGADHETGRLVVENGQRIPPGTAPLLAFGSSGHTAGNVPLFATWPPALDGRTIDNTEIFFLMEDYLFDGVPPVIEGLAVEGVSGQTTVTWTTAEAATSRIEFGIDPSYGSTLTDPELTNLHEIVLTDLVPATEYHFRVSSSDLLGTERTSADGTFTTAGPPPRAPSGVIALDRDSVTVSWHASDDRDVTGYGVYRAEGLEGPRTRIDTARHVSLVDAGETWRYNDTGLDLGTSWREPDFNDDEWNTGPAPLGYGVGDESTIISFGPDPEQKHITYYFRRSFELSADTEVDRITLALQRDDGAVVYLNGNEVSRSNMPPEAIFYRTRANRSDSSSNSFLLSELPTSALLVGMNFIAVEVHQTSRGSTDMRFDLALTGLPNVAVEETHHQDAAAPRGMDLFYAVTAIDRFSRESPLSLESCVNPGAPRAPFDVVSTGAGAEFRWRSNRECDLAAFRVYRSVTPDAPRGPSLAAVPADTLSFADTTILPDTTYFYRVTALDKDQNEGPPSGTFRFPPGGKQRPGDCNQDSILNLSDPICILNALFGRPIDRAGFRLPCANRSPSHPANQRLLDFNGDGRPAVELTDALATLNFLFLSGPPHPLGSSCLPIADCPDNAGCE